MNKYEFDLLLAQDMDEAIARAEKNGVQSMKDKIKGCFLYKYLKAKKDIAAERLFHSVSSHIGKRTDKYIVLKCAYLARCEAADSKKSDDKYIAVYRKIMGRMPCSDIKKAQSDAEDELLAGMVSDYVGRNTKITTKVTDSNKREKLRVLKNIKESANNVDHLDMYSEFIRAKNIEYTTGFASRAADCSEEHMKKCEELYYIMCRDKKYKKAYVPLFCDSSNGAGVYIMGKEYFDESAMIQIFKDKTGTDINILRRMINSQDTPDDMAAVKRILYTSGFNVDSISAIIKKRTYAFKIAEKILRSQRYTADKIKVFLNECALKQKKLSEILRSDPSQYDGDSKDVISKSVYDDEVLLNVLTKHGFSFENAEIILRKRSIAENDILPLLELCYPCVVNFDIIQEQATFNPISYALDFSILTKIKVCFSIADAFKYLSDYAEVFDTEYSCENEGLPIGADERFRLKMEGELNRDRQNT